MPRRKKETFYTKISPYVLSFVIGFVFVVSLGLVVYKVYTDNLDSIGEDLSAHRKILKAENEPVLTKTAFWVVYEDKKYDFNLKYPVDKLKIVNDEPLFAKFGICTRKEEQTVTLEPIQYNKDSLPQDVYSNLIRLTVHAQKLDKNFEIDYWFERNCKDYFPNEENYTKRISKINDNKFLIVTDKKQEDERYQKKTVYNFYIINQTVYIVTKSYSFDKSVDQDAIKEKEKILDNIISTMDFK